MAFPSTGIVAYWNFEEGSGDLLDQVGSRDGTNSNISYQQTGKNNYGYTYNGSTSGTVIADDNVFSPATNDFTCSVWFKTTATGDSTTLVGKGGWVDGGANDNYEWQIQIDSNGYPTFLVMEKDGTPLAYEQISTDCEDNAWHLVVVSYTNNSAKIYLDGGSASEDTSCARSSLTNGTDSFRIGRCLDGTTYFTGSIDEVGFWNRILTLSETQDIWNSGTGTFYSAAAGWSGKIMGLSAPAKVNGIAVANISKVNGVS